MGVRGPQAPKHISLWGWWGGEASPPPPQRIKLRGMKFFDFLNDRGGSVELQALDQPAGEFQSPLDVFEQALDHERKVTALIHRLYELALKESDYATQTLLQWFITEQVEEEKNAGQIVEQLKMTGGEPSALLLLDRDLAGRGAAA